MKRVRVLVVDDSAFARKVLREALTTHPAIEVVGIARDGLDALESIAELRPDVVTLDLLMPNLDGIGVLSALDPVTGPRVVVVSMSDGDSALAIRALESGAVDLVHKPTALATDRLYELSDELCRKVIAAAAAHPAPFPALPLKPVVPPLVPASVVHAVVIGTSTGGPQALSRVLPMLPASLPVPVLVALHIPEGYTDALARRLDEACPLAVVEASGSLELGAGVVVIARGGSHLVVERRGGRPVARVDVTNDGALYWPSVDRLFESAVATYGAGVLGVVLTGMGDDGLKGARAIRAAGGVVIAESASSCVVDGMPRSVRDAGLANTVAPLGAIAESIVALTGG